MLSEYALTFYYICSSHPRILLHFCYTCYTCFVRIDLIQYCLLLLLLHIFPPFHFHILFRFLFWFSIFLFTNFLLELDLLVLTIFLDAVNYNATVSVVPICGVATSESGGRSSVRSISAFVPFISFAKIPAAKFLCTKRDLCSKKESFIVKTVMPIILPQNAQPADKS